MNPDRERFTDFYKELDAKDHVETVTDTVAVAPIKYTGQALIQQDIDNFKAALKDVGRALNIPLSRVDQVTKLIPTKLVGDPATVAAKTYSTKDSSSTTTTAK